MLQPSRAELVPCRARKAEVVQILSESKRALGAEEGAPSGAWGLPGCCQGHLISIRGKTGNRGTQQGKSTSPQQEGSRKTLDLAGYYDIITPLQEWVPVQHLCLWNLLRPWTS